MNKNILKHLNNEQQALVLESVRQAEAGTSGEIVPMIVDSSDDYREAASQAATLLASFLSAIISVAAGDTSIWLFIPATFILYFPVSYIVNFLPPLKLAFTPSKRIRKAVQQSAVRAFHEHGLHRTRDANGILIFVSMLERKVWILGDRGINSVISPNVWNSLAAGLAAGIRDNRMAETLAATISEVGTILKKHFPAKSDDSNELPDLLAE